MSLFGPTGILPKPVLMNVFQLNGGLVLALQSMDWSGSWAIQTIAELYIPISRADGS